MGIGWRQARSILFSLVLVAVLLAGGAIIARVLASMREEPPRRAQDAPVPVVPAVRLVRETLTEEVIGYGSVAAARSTRISAEVSGRIERLVGGHREGDLVDEDELLIEIDDRNYQAALSGAESLVAADREALAELAVESERLGTLVETAQREVELAQSEFDRVSKLFDRSLAARKEYDVAAMAFQQATRVLDEYRMRLALIEPRSKRVWSSLEARRSEARAASLSVERCRIRAPYAGRLAARFVDEGDWVSPGAPLLSIVDAAEVEIVAQLPASRYHRIVPDAPCRVTTESLSGVTWSGRVLRKAPLVDDTSRTFSIYVSVDNRDEAAPCVPGMFVTIKVDGREYVDVFAVPRGAVVDGTVLLVVGGEAVLREVQVVQHIGDRVVIDGPLAAGDILLTSRLSRVEPGAEVVPAFEAEGMPAYEADAAGNADVVGEAGPEDAGRGSRINALGGGAPGSDGASGTGDASGAGESAGVGPS